MIVVEFLFAVSTVVEVLADGALVTYSDDRRFTAAIARNSNVSDDLFSYWLLRLLNFRDLEADTLVLK
jgi:hypothetical protein